MFKFENGQKVRDIIGGFEGTITGGVDYLNGYKQYHTIPKYKDKTTKPEGRWIDEVQLELLDEKPLEIKSILGGGPAINPPPGMTIR